MNVEKGTNGEEENAVKRVMAVAMTIPPCRYRTTVVMD